MDAWIPRLLVALVHLDPVPSEAAPTQCMQSLKCFVSSFALPVSVISSRSITNISSTIMPLIVCSSKSLPYSNLGQSSLCFSHVLDSAGCHSNRTSKCTRVGRTLAALPTLDPSSRAMESQPTRRSHFIPRTRDGWIACISFLVIFMLAMPPVTHTLLNRSEPWIFGFPFIYGALFAVYTVLICVLIWALRRGL